MLELPLKGWRRVSRQRWKTTIKNRSLFHLLSHSLTHLGERSLMPSFIDPLTVPVTQLLSHSFTYMCSLSLNHVVTQSLRYVYMYVCMHLLQILQLNSLINMLLGELSPGDRQKIMTLCTIDVHARDVVAKLISQKVTMTTTLPYILCSATFLVKVKFLWNNIWRQHTVWTLPVKICF